MHTELTASFNGADVAFSGHVIRTLLIWTYSVAPSTGLRDNTEADRDSSNRSLISFLRGGVTDAKFLKCTWSPKCRSGSAGVWSISRNLRSACTLLPGPIMTDPSGIVFATRDAHIGSILNSGMIANWNPPVESRPVIWSLIEAPSSKSSIWAELLAACCLFWWLFLLAR